MIKPKLWFEQGFGRALNMNLTRITENDLIVLKLTCIPEYFDSDFLLLGNQSIGSSSVPFQ